MNEEPFTKWVASVENIAVVLTITFPKASAKQVDKEREMLENKRGLIVKGPWSLTLFTKRDADIEKGDE